MSNINVVFPTQRLITSEIGGSACARMTIEGIASGVDMCEGQAEGARALAAMQAQQARRLAVKQALLDACSSGLRSQRLKEAPHLDAKAVARHTPAVARGFCSAWPCCAPAGAHRWTDARLLEWCAGAPLRVRVIAPHAAQGEGGAASTTNNGKIFGDPTSAAARGDVYEWAELPAAEALARCVGGAAAALATGKLPSTCFRVVLRCTRPSLVINSTPEAPQISHSEQWIGPRLLTRACVSVTPSSRLGAGTAYAARVPLRELPALACRVPPATEAAPFVWALGAPIDGLATMYLSGQRACTPCHWDPHEVRAAVLRLRRCSCVSLLLRIRLTS